MKYWFSTLCLLIVLVPSLQAADREQRLDPQQAAASPTGAAPQTDLLKALQQPGLGQGENDELLDAEQAFIPAVSAPDAESLVASWTVAEGYYLYKAKLKISLADAPGLSIVSLEFSPGKIKNDEFFGRQEVFYNKATVTARLRGEWPVSGDIEVRLDYQGCAEVGVCYMPQTQTIPVVLTSSTGTGATPPSAQTETTVPEALASIHTSH